MLFRWGVAVVLLLGGCGRVGFDDVPLGDGNGSSPDAPRLDYPLHNIEAVLATTNVSMLPVTSGTITGFTVSPALPAGMALDPQTGAITGTPTAMIDNGLVTVTASGPGGVASISLVVTVLPGYVVDVIADGTDDDGGTDAMCNSAAAGGCTFRAAIQTTNRRGSKQLILLPAGALQLTGAIEAVMNDVEIAGTGATKTSLAPSTIHPGYGLFSVSSPARLWVKDLEAQQFGTTDGAVFAVVNADVHVDHARFSDNAGNGRGGVALVLGTSNVTFDDCTFESNSSIPGNGWGGVIDGEGTGVAITVRRSFAASNLAAWGSFAHITTGTTLLLENSTLFGNSSSISGTLATPGGVYTLINDTIVGNTNTNPNPDGANAASAGIYLYNTPCHYDVVNTIIAGNTDFAGIERNCNIRDTTTTITSHGGNILSDDGRNCANYFNAPGDRLLSYPGVDDASVGNHGGPTFTIPILASSIAQDTAISSSCPATDQRGVPRGIPCDVGAFESP